MGKTLSSLFSEFSKDEVMQLYLYPSLPNTKQFDQYYRMTDHDAIHSIWKRNRCGRVISPQEISEANLLFETETQAQAYNSKNRSSDIARRVRDLIWSLGNWKTDGLRQWLTEGKPDVVFYALGDAIFSQNIAMWIAKFLNIPLVAYVCDEFYVSGKKRPLLSRIINHSMLRNLKKLQTRSVHNVVICEELGKLYQQQFGVPYTTIMTGSPLTKASRVNTESRHISYIGNLGLNRWQSLLEIAQAIDAVNQKHNWDYRLTYYGKQLEQLEGRIPYGGYLNSRQLKETMENSLFVIHTEAFDEENVERIRYSVSTKIAETLAGGIPLLAYGPEPVASMQHLIKHGCAVCVTGQSELQSTLTELFSHPQALETISQKALETAQQHHDPVRNSQTLSRCLRSVCLHP